MFGLQNLETRQFEALFFHIPKTAGSLVKTYVRDNYKHQYVLRQLHGVLPYHNRHDLPMNEVGMHDHSHLTIDQAFDIYPTLDEWIEENNIDVFCITRDPYERFVSCLRFIPVMMNLDIDGSGIPKFRGQYAEDHFHAVYTYLLMSPQARWICKEGEPFARTIHLDDVKGTVAQVTDNVSVDFTKKVWTNEDASHKMLNDFVIPKFPLDGETKKFVEWLWKEDFDLGLHRGGIAQ